MIIVPKMDQEGNLKSLVLNENDITLQNLRDTMKAVLREMFMALCDYTKKYELSIKNLMICLKSLGKQE